MQVGRLAAAVDKASGDGAADVLVARKAGRRIMVVGGHRVGVTVLRVVVSQRVQVTAVCLPEDEVPLSFAPSETVARADVVVPLDRVLTTVPDAHPVITDGLPRAAVW